MKICKKFFVLALKQLELGSAVAVRLTKITGKSKIPLHPKHFLTQRPWYLKFIKKSDRVLDLGCGVGQSSLKTAKVARRVIGLDKSYKLLNLARLLSQDNGLKNINFEKGDLEQKIRFNNNSFDKVIFLDVLEHLNRRDQILKEIYRVLKPDGLLFLSVPNSGTFWKRTQRSVDVNSFSDPDHKIEFTESQIKSLLAKHGFKIKKISYGPYDTPLRGLFDIIGGFSIVLYKKISTWRYRQAKENPTEASGFEIIARK